MKKLIIVNGTMGVGKTTTCEKLNNCLERSVWLDGDWCWMMNPWIINDENKTMVIKNITYQLRNFLISSTFNYVIFSWVIHKEEISNTILDNLKDLDYELYKITITCSQEVLKRRMIIGDRSQDGIKESLKRLDMYTNMDTIKIDTTDMTVDEAVNEIKLILKR